MEKGMWTEKGTWTPQQVSRYLETRYELHSKRSFDAYGFKYDVDFSVSFKNVFQEKKISAIAVFAELPVFLINGICPHKSINDFGESLI